MQQDKYVRPRELMKDLPVARSTVYAWLKSGEIKSQRIGGTLLIPQSEVDKVRALLAKS